jgi:hypothetical protein
VLPTRLFCSFILPLEAAVKSSLLLAGLFAIAAPIPAYAFGCDGPGSANARIVTIPTESAQDRLGLGIAIELGLNPASFPDAYIAKIATPCRRTVFQVGSDQFGLFGVEKRDQPPRYAKSETGHDTRTAYLAALPRPMPAIASAQAGLVRGVYKFKPQDFIFVLAVTKSTDRLFFRFYDAIPDDATVAQDMCATLAGEDIPIGSYDSLTGKSVLYATSAPRKLSRGPHCRQTIS